MRKSLSMSTEKRKGDHIRVCLEEDVEFFRGNGFDEFSFTHNALPEVDWNEIDISTRFLGRKFSAPIFIGAVTGGTTESVEINKNLAKAAQELGIGMGLGSQRAMIESPSLAKTFKVRDVAPDIFLVGNIGASQILKYGYTPEKISRALEEIGANALAIHLNPAQELAQKGGNRDWKGALESIEKIKSGIKLPVIVKEVGNGISGDVAKKLAGVGVDAIDVAGSGGTNWVKVDSIIAKTPYEAFYEWGIPTAVALEQCLASVKIPIIASGGIRNGIDAAKALSMGASLAGMSLPLLRPACDSAGAVKAALEKFINELKTTMFLTSSKNLSELRRKAIKI
ncbi:MAG: type 2 isopentenyl-diphosphate Delta-isomerase [Candidatus Aenigmatarchaeota archaeon]|nr:MAG: type 2 isopentenyl-diphosphate Delta-isomerase [Candidatus Aenigmarchaeota archaeon]